MMMFLFFIVLLYAVAMTLAVIKLRSMRREEFEELQSWRKIFTRGDDLHTIVH